MTDSDTNMLQKLMMSGQLIFKNGSITLFGNRMLLHEASLFSEIIKNTNNSAECAKLLYDAAQNSLKAGMATDIGKKFKFNINDFYLWMPMIGNFNGWGKIKVPIILPEKGYGEAVLEDSPIVANLKGKVKGPVDHLMAGYIAGSAELMYKAEIECKETECAADGAAMCKFVFRWVKKE